MNKARVQIQKGYGDYTDKFYIFYTDIIGLRAGDIVTVLTKYGIQLAVFIEYDNSNYEPNNFLIDRISGSEIILRKKELKDKLINSKLKEMNDFIAKIHAL